MVPPRRAAPPPVRYSPNHRTLEAVQILHRSWFELARAHGVAVGFGFLVPSDPDDDPDTHEGYEHYQDENVRHGQSSRDTPPDARPFVHVSGRSGRVMSRGRRSVCRPLAHSTGEIDPLRVANLRDGGSEPPRGGGSLRAVSWKGSALQSKPWGIPAFWPS
jgi:hypothetical protein